jgi:hypothetical protein
MNENRQVYHNEHKSVPNKYVPEIFNSHVNLPRSRQAAVSQRLNLATNIIFWNICQKTATGLCDIL